MPDYSVYFDGSNDFISNTSASFNFGSNNFTIECWVYMWAPTENALRMIYTNYNTWAAQSIYFGKHTNNSGRVTVWVNNYSASTPLLVDPDLPSASWIHYALVRNSSDWRLYRNGNFVANNTYSGSATTNTLTNVGGNQEASGSYSWNGLISNFRIVNSAVYTANFTVSTSNLTAITNTVLLTCANSTIKDNSTGNLTLTRTGLPYVVGANPFSVDSGPTFLDANLSVGLSSNVLINGTQVFLDSNITSNTGFATTLTIRQLTGNIEIGVNANLTAFLMATSNGAGFLDANITSNTGFGATSPIRSLVASNVETTNNVIATSFPTGLVGAPVNFDQFGNSSSGYISVYPIRTLTSSSDGNITVLNLSPAPVVGSKPGFDSNATTGLSSISPIRAIVTELPYSLSRTVKTPAQRQRFSD